MAITFHKVVSALPTLANTIAGGLYFVRVGAGFDIHLANSDATAVHKINLADRYIVETKTGPYTITSADLGKLLIIDDVPTFGAIAVEHVGQYVTLVSRAAADVTIAGTGLFGETLITPNGVRSAVVTAVDEWQLG